MKLRPIHIILAGFFLLSLTATQCEKEPPTLPPETQIGANTFGCYVNEELFIPGKPNLMGNNIKPISSGYSTERKILVVQCIAPNSKMFFVVNNPQENEYTSFDTLRFTKFGIENICSESDNICFEFNNLGRVFITKLDTINNIASGRFDVKFNNF